jgi:uncharacterized ferritin-like protein (DUF455 family)
MFSYAKLLGGGFPAGESRVVILRQPQNHVYVNPTWWRRYAARQAPDTLPTQRTLAPHNSDCTSVTGKDRRPQSGDAPELLSAVYIY